MRKRFTIAFILAACCLSACRSSLDADGTGFVRFGVIEDPSVTDAVSPAVRSNLLSLVDSLPGENDFVLTVFRDDSELWSGMLPDWPVRKRIPIKGCKVTASCGTGEEGYCKPVLTGEQMIVIAGFDTTDVTVTVRLANCLVKAGFSETFTSYFPTHEVKITTGAGNEFFFDEDGDEPAFIDPYKFSATCACINQGGADVNLGPFAYDNLKAGVCYTLYFDVKNIGTTSVTVSVSLDDIEEEIDLGIIELN